MTTAGVDYQQCDNLATPSTNCTLTHATKASLWNKKQSFGLLINMLQWKKHSGSQSRECPKGASLRDICLFPHSCLPRHPL